jgi:hypothetical protein
MIFLFVALVLFIIAAFVFIAEFAKWFEPKSVLALGLGLVASGLACWLIDILHAAGKF